MGLNVTCLEVVCKVVAGVGTWVGAGTGAGTGIGVSGKACQLLYPQRTTLKTMHLQPESSIEACHPLGQPLVCPVLLLLPALLTSFLVMGFVLQEFFFYSQPFGKQGCSRYCRCAEDSKGC